MTFERAGGVPYREYPVAARPVLGVRFCTVCGIDGSRGPGFLLWSDEPFTSTVVARELVRLGFEVAGVSRTADPWRPWSARVGGEPEPAGEVYLGRHDGDCSAVEWIGLWSRHRDRVIHDEPEHGWLTLPAGRVLGDPLPVVHLTEQQAIGLAILAGRRLPTAGELAASRTGGERPDLKSFYDHRATLFGAEAERVRTEGARLAAVPPPRRPVSDAGERWRVVARHPALTVRVGEPFPLARFLVGSFHDRSGDDFGSHTALCNRLAVVTGDGTLGLTLEVLVRGGLLVHPGAVTPYCPAEAGYLDDPELVRAQAGQRWPDPLWCAVFPVSPARFEVRAETEPGAAARQRISIALTFPGGQEFVALPAWGESFHLWDCFVPGDGPPDDGHEIFVPDDLHLVKSVQARIVSWP